jgi:hypothetical protein
MTPTTPAQEVVLKTDVLGRVKTPLARREQLLDEFEQSGLSGQKFAQLTGLRYPTFASWVQKRRRQRGAYPAPKAPPKAADTLRWLEAVVAPGADGKIDSGEAGLVVRLPGGARLEITHAGQAALAAALLRALEKAGAC